MRYDVLIAGVGGQGTLLTAKIIATAGLKEDHFVRTSETIGMAQRGGSVVSHVRIGAKNAGSIIPLGSADLLIGFEPAEAAKNLSRVKKNGICVVNEKPVVPVSASLKKGGYPISEIKTYLEKEAKARLVNAYDAAGEIGSYKTLNVVLLGTAFGIGALPFERKTLEETIIDLVPEKFADMNLKAFAAGIQLGAEKEFINQ